MNDDKKSELNAMLPTVTFNELSLSEYRYYECKLDPMI